MRSGAWLKPHHDAGVPLRLAVVHHPDDIAIAMKLDARYACFRFETLGVMTFDEQREFSQVHQS